MKLTKQVFASLVFCVPWVSWACGGTSAPAQAPQSARAQAVAFENPGGMWMPQQISAHADILRSLRIELDPQTLTNPLSPPLAAIVSLGGCSASFVSPEGLIITNHHCVQGTLQYHSSPTENLVENGFLAQTRADERWNGPAARVYVTQGIRDVTGQMLEGLERMEDPRQRYDVLEAREKQLVAECEANRPHIRCSVASYFRGAEYHLIEKLEIRDIRLVYAPHRGIGWFGGDEDNWMWPRHTGDYSFYRAYVGKDGMPADYSPDNLPYQPKHFLRIGRAPLRKGDFVMIAGYPGMTFRHRTAAEVEESVSWHYPRLIASLEEGIAVLEDVSKRGQATAIKASPWISGMQNRLKKSRGLLDTLTQGGLAQSKIAMQAELAAWIQADAARQAAYGEILPAMAALHEQRKATRDRNADLSGVSSARLVRVAQTIVRMAEERPKADSERDPEYQERNWKSIVAGTRSLQRSYDREIDRAMLALSLRRAARNTQANREWLELIMGGPVTGPIDEAAITRTVDRLYGSTVLENEETRVALLTQATMENLRTHTDPLIQMALALRPLQKQIEEQDKRYAGAMAVLMPRYIQALREMSQGMIAPDANGTLRISYGTVRGYRPRADAPVFEPFTLLSQVVAKHRGAQPFEVPKPLLEAAQQTRPWPYVDSELGEIPVNFLADLDATGGNSGSATLNAQGELVGLLFDTTYEGMSSDWQFRPSLTRSIHVDMRYVLWIMDAVDRAHHLMREMGVEPAAQ